MWSKCDKVIGTSEYSLRIDCLVHLIHSSFWEDVFVFRLPHIGLVVEKLMGNAYKSSYTTSEFRSKYSAFMKKFRVRDASACILVLNQRFRRSDHCFQGRGYGGKTCPTGGGSGGRSRGGSGAMSRQSTEPSGFLGGYPAPSTAEPIAEGVAAASGSRALSNHILWRSAFRRDVGIFIQLRFETEWYRSEVLDTRCRGMVRVWRGLYVAMLRKVEENRSR